MLWLHPKWYGNAQSTYKTCAWSGHMDHIQRPFLSNGQDHIMLFKSVATNICLGPELVILTARSSSTTITLISCCQYLIHYHLNKSVPFSSPDGGFGQKICRVLMRVNIRSPPFIFGNSLSYKVIRNTL